MGDVPYTDSLVAFQQGIGWLLRVALVHEDIDESTFAYMSRVFSGVYTKKISIIVPDADVWSVATEGGASCQVIVQTDGHTDHGWFRHGWGEMHLAEPVNAEVGPKGTDDLTHI